ncbi:MAG: ribonuclease Z [Ardenticatenaceae bacterium]
MFELLFLGTSASAPSVSRNVTSTLLLYREYRFLIDAGEGTQRQLLQSGVGFRKLEHVLLTHGHLDHILGLAGLVSTFSRWDIEKQTLCIYGTRHTLQRVRDLVLGVALRGQRTRLWIEFKELTDGVFFEDAKFQISAFPVQHRGSDSLGYLFQTKARRPFLNEQADALGVPFGPERSQLVKGEAITLPDGRVIHPDDVLGPAIPGKKLVYIGDVDNPQSLLPIVRNADALIIEATYADEESQMVRTHGHITARTAATFARKANIKALYLNHISRRYNGRELQTQAREVFPNAVVVRDFDRVTV